ncbi:hypothetical protein BOX15_Mlig001984g3 [Macrostomum lignano]|uniref:Transglutaminase-like domain-containing protein n=1 Tax=Macrostomum lignano TaxID=282301 RepID=A0A267EEC9_9PLAT|nr:hypothetical protein BOX15_Mlig001984g3 [Macrostomum lignano]
MGCNSSRPDSGGGVAGVRILDNDTVAVDAFGNAGGDGDDEYPTGPEDYEFGAGEIPLDRFALSPDQEDYVTPQYLQSMQRVYQAEAAKQGRFALIENEEERRPPLTDKETLVAPELLARADAIADATPLEVAGAGFDVLVGHLCDQVSTELEAVRVLFRWMAVTTGNRRVDALLEGAETTQEDPLHYIRCIREGRGINYVLLLHRLLRHAGIAAEVVGGVTKGAQYRIGHHVNEDNASLWLAVLVEGQWRLIDPIWACQVLQGYDSGEWSRLDEAAAAAAASDAAAGTSAAAAGEVGFAISEFYFLTDPHYAVLEHFPYDPRWQLLPRPISLEEFEEMPQCEPEEMERLGLEIVSHPKCVFEIRDSGLSQQERRLGLHIKKGQDNTLEFQEEPREAFAIYSARLYIHASALNSEATGSEIQYKSQKWQLAHFCITGHSVKKRELFITVIPPVAGKFLLKLFGARCADSCLRHVISYVFHCRRPAEVAPVPAGNLTEWGPGGQTAEAGLDPLTHPDPLVETVRGEARLRFATESNHLQYSIELRSTDNGIRFLELYSIHWMENGEAVFHLRAPKEGLYAACISCRLPSGRVVPVCDYLIDSQAPCQDPDFLYPRLKEPLGVNSDACRSLDTEPLAPHQFGYLECATRTLRVVWRMGRPLLYCVTMRLQDHRGHHDYTDLILVETSVAEARASVSIKFPQYGYYHLAIGAAPDSGSESAREVRHLCNYVIKFNGEPYVDATPFPRPTPLWQRGFRLMSPDSSQLEAGRYVQIVVKADRRVKFGQLQLRVERPQLLMFYLQRDADNPVYWKSTIDAGPPGGVWTLSALPDPDDVAGSVAGPLMQFQVLDAKAEADAQKRRDEWQELLEYCRKQNAAYEERLVQLEQMVREQARTLDEVLAEERIRVLREAEDGDDEAMDLDEATLADIEEQAKIQLGKAGSSADPEERAKREQIARDAAVRVAKSRLRAAIRQEDLEGIGRGLDRLRELEIQDEKLVELAERTVRITGIKKDLASASAQSLSQRAAGPLRAALDRARKTGLLKESHPLLSEAAAALVRVDRMERLYKRVLSLDGKAVAELRAYVNPKQAIVDTVRATLLLLGEYEKRTNSWQKCLRYLNPTGKTSMQQRIAQFSPASGLHPSIAARAKVMLAPYSEEEVIQSSAAAAAFFSWSLGTVIESEESSNPRDFQPANIERQRKLLGVSKEEHSRLLWEGSGGRK